MTNRRTIQLADDLVERMLTSRAGSAAPPDLADTVLGLVSGTRQRRRSWLGRLGESPTPRPVALLAAAFATAALALVIAAGGLLNPRPPTTIATLPPPSTPAPTPVVTPFPVARLQHNGLIAIVRAGALVLADPLTGKTTKVLVETPADESSPYAASDLTWAPDGRRLAFVSHDGPVFVIDVSTGKSQSVHWCGTADTGCSIAWSPDGARIAVTHGSELWLIDPGGENATVPLHFSDSVLQPTWSPDGLRIAFQAMAPAQADQRRLYVVDRDGSNLTLLLGPVGGIGAWDPAWSPDGSSIAYLGSTDHQTCPPSVAWASQRPCQDDWQLHINILGLDGSGPRELVEAGVCWCLGFMPGLTWSPDGSSLAAVIPSGDTRDWGPSILQADGTGARWIGDAWGPVAWQPVP
jgi:hypothetical protein